MSDLRLPGKDFFSRGIDRIVTPADASPAGLPKQTTLPPVEHVARSSLDRLLAASRFEDELDRALRPRISDSSLLRPGEFHRALQDARALLGRQPPSRIVAGAIELLQEEEALRELVQMHRSALYSA